MNVLEKGDPTLVSCSIHDHPDGGVSTRSGYGVHMQPSAAGLATVGADCIFARNAKDVVRGEGYLS